MEAGIASLSIKLINPLSALCPLTLSSAGLEVLVPLNYELGHFGLPLSRQQQAKRGVTVW